MDNPPEYIIYLYGEYQPLFNQMSVDIPNIQFIEGVPGDMDQLINPSRRGLMVLDDLISEVSTAKWLTNLFTKGSHHKNLSIILISQNMFQQGREMRTIGLNTEYYIIFKNPRDRSQITNLGKQTHPGHVKFLRDSYVDATSNPYSYLLLDLKGGCPEEVRVRTNIFPGEKHLVYVPRKPL